MTRETAEAIHAARTLKGYCQAHPWCEGCVFIDFECELSYTKHSPGIWPIDEFVRRAENG